jgi:hypothetical protein
VAGGAFVLVLVAVGAVQGRTAKPSPHLEAAPPVAAFTGPALTERTGLRLIVAGYTLTELDLDTGVRRQVTGVPATPNGYDVVRTDGGAVLARAQGLCLHCPGPVYLVPPGQLEGVPLDGWDAVAPGATPDRLWAYARDAGTVRELDLAGHPVSPAYRLADPVSVLERGTVAGLIVLHGLRGQIIDPATGHVRYEFGWVIAATADRVAWVEPACRVSCAMTVLDLRTGDSRTYPTAGRPLGGAFGVGGLAVSVAAPGAQEQVQAYLLSGGTLRPLSTPVAGMSLDWSGRYLLLATVGGLITDGQPTLSAALAATGWAEVRRIALSGLTGAQLILR